jgi:hypothetical protein
MKTHCISITKANLLMLFKEVIARNSEKHAEYKYIRWENFKVEVMLVWININIFGL